LLDTRTIWRARPPQPIGRLWAELHGSCATGGLARLASAEVAEPDPEADHVVFGMAVTVLREDETEATFRTVGEDEADPSTGRIAWTAPVVQALLGSRPGDLRQLPTGEVEVLSISGTPEALE
jgi:Transcription elongation factor, GreA/GreB, C-term